MPVTRRVKITCEVVLGASTHVMKISRPVTFTGNPRDRESVLRAILGATSDDVVRALGPEVLRNE